MTEGNTAAATEELDRGTVLALVAMALGVFVIANDFTALSVAIPRLESSLHADLGTAQWVINGYALIFGVMIVTGGRLADMFGRKRAFMLGSVLFAAFSLLGGLAPNVELLIACALMGIGGAMMWPAILGMTYAVLPDSRAGLAGGLILGVAGIGNAVGPMLGGVLTEELSWRWVFFLNVPIALFAMWVTARRVPETVADTGDRTIDYKGIAAITVGGIAILAALDNGPTAGFGSPEILALFGLGIVSLAAFAGRGPAAATAAAWCPPTCCATAPSPPRASRCCSCRRSSSPRCSTFRSSSARCSASRRSSRAPGCCR